MGFFWSFILGAVFGACLGAFIIGLFAGGRIQDIPADMYNPKNVSKRTARK